MVKCVSVISGIILMRTRRLCNEILYETEVVILA